MKKILIVLALVFSFAFRLHASNLGIRIVTTGGNFVGRGPGNNGSGGILRGIIAVDPNGNTLTLYHASLTFTATGASVTAAVVCQGQPALINVVGYSISTDTAANIVLHTGGSAYSLSNVADTIIGGGRFAVNGRETYLPGTINFPGTVTNTAVTVDISAACANVFVSIWYSLL